MKHLPAVLEVIGAACLVVAASLVAAALAWLVAGVAITAKAWELEVRSHDRPRRPLRSTQRRAA